MLIFKIVAFKRPEHATPVKYLQWDTPRLIKIDVEGSDLDLLHGADRLLSQIRPILMCESQHRNRPAASAIFRRYNYKLYDWDADSRVELETAAFNTLAIPG